MTPQLSQLAEIEERISALQDEIAGMLEGTDVDEEEDDSPPMVGVGGFVNSYNGDASWVLTHMDDPHQRLIWDEMERADLHPDDAYSCSCGGDDLPCRCCNGTCFDCGTWLDIGNIVNTNEDGDCLVCLGELAPARY